jgi:hypothetical protein
LPLCGKDIRLVAWLQRRSSLRHQCGKELYSGIDSTGMPRARPPRRCDLAALIPGTPASCPLLGVGGERVCAAERHPKLYSQVGTLLPAPSYIRCCDIIKAALTFLSNGPQTCDLRLLGLVDSASGGIIWQCCRLRADWTGRIHGMALMDAEPVMTSRDLYSVADGTSRQVLRCTRLVCRSRMHAQRGFRCCMPVRVDTALAQTTTLRMELKYCSICSL